VLILVLFGVSGFDLERLRIHVSPVRVLEVRRAVEEERGKSRLELLEVMEEDVALQLVEYRCALPPSRAGAAFA